MYGPAKNPYAVYQKNEIESLMPVEIVCRLYQKLHTELRAALEAIQKGQSAAKGESLGRALAIIGELQASLNLEKGGEIALNLNDLFHFLTMELSMVTVSSDAERLSKTIGVVGPLVEAWEQTVISTKKQGKMVPMSPEVAQKQSFQATY